MEASEATESTEAQAPETDPTTDAPQEAEATEQETSEAAPPELGDALHSIRQQQEELLRRIPGGEQDQPQDFAERFQPRVEEDDEYEYEGEQQQAPGDQGAQEEALLNEIIDERVQGFMRPILESQEISRRSEAIRALPEKYPKLKEAEVANAVANMANDHMTRLGFQQGTIPPPEVVEAMYKVWSADAVAAGENPAEAQGRGATLEQGAGPSAPEPETDPIQKAYEDAMKAAVGNDSLTT